MTRVAKLVVVAAGWTLITPATPHFSDAPGNSPYYSYIETGLAQGVISGYADGAFRPQAYVTRGQLAKMVAVASPLTSPPEGPEVAPEP